MDPARIPLNGVHQPVHVHFGCSQTRETKGNAVAEENLGERLADEALAVVDATATPYIVARAMLARAHALAITETSGAAQATEQAAALLDKVGLSSEAHRVRHNRSSQ